MTLHTLAESSQQELLSTIKREIIVVSFSSCFLESVQDCACEVIYFLQSAASTVVGMECAALNLVRLPECTVLLACYHAMVRVSASAYPVY